MDKDLEEIFSLIKSKGYRHLCFISLKDFVAVSQTCDENDLYLFLYSMCANVPWAKEVIEKFIEDQEDENEVRVEGDDSQYLN